MSGTKCDLGNFEKAMFQRVAPLCALIFRLLAAPKCGMGEVEQPMFQVVDWAKNSFSSTWLAKMGLGPGRETDVSKRHMAV
jgi:hypothetical protein